MTKAVLTLNSGSSSLKVALFSEIAETALLTALADRIGPQGTLKLKNAQGEVLPAAHGDLSNHENAMRMVIDSFRLAHPSLDLLAIGHRVVHGGSEFTVPIKVDDTILSKLDALSAFAPLHQPHNLSGIRAAQGLFPAVPQVACFDTAFHRNHPWVSDTFALPRALYDEGVRRYGFHGLSYEYVSAHLTQIAPAVAKGRVIIAHLGNGASMCAIDNGRSVASSMGFTALDGLPMGTRCGQLDPGVLLYLMQQRGMSAEAISDMLYKQSGLLGLSNLSNDMRTLEASDTAEARQAIDYFVHRCQRELGSLAAAMGGVDAVVFCGGIGENSHFIRARICETLGWMGISLDESRNAAHARVISNETARTAVMVVPTNEELVIARSALALSRTEGEAL